MKLIVDKAPTFEIDPKKSYVCLVQDNDQWNDDQRNQLKETLIGVNIGVVFIPHGSKFKLAEVPD